MDLGVELLARDTHETRRWESVGAVKKPVCPVGSCGLVLFPITGPPHRILPHHSVMHYNLACSMEDWGELMFWSSWLWEWTYSKQEIQPQEFVHSIVWPAVGLVTFFGKGNLANAFHCSVMSMCKRVTGSQCLWSRLCCWKLCPGATVPVPDPPNSVS